MIVSETANRVTARWLQACVLLCAVVVLPVGITYAQDYDAVGKRLRAAVEAGKMPKADAEKKLIAIRMEMWPPEKDGEEDGDEGGLEAVGEYLRGIGERIRAAVAEGKLSEEDGWAKWHEVKKETIKGAVAAGKISREEAGLLWREIEKAEAAARLFTSAPILPAADGRLIKRDRLHNVTFTDDEGEKHNVNCMMLIVKRIAEEDYRLYGIGKNAHEPLIDGRFDNGEGPGQTPLALEVKDIDEERCVLPVQCGERIWLCWQLSS